MKTQTISVPSTNRLALEVEKRAGQDGLLDANECGEIGRAFGEDIRSAHKWNTGLEAGTDALYSAMSYSDVPLKVQLTGDDGKVSREFMVAVADGSALSICSTDWYD